MFTSLSDYDYIDEMDDGTEVPINPDEYHLQWYIDKYHICDTTFPISPVYAFDELRTSYSISVCDLMGLIDDEFPEIIEVMKDYGEPTVVPNEKELITDLCYIAISLGISRKEITATTMHADFEGKVSEDVLVAFEKSMDTTKYSIAKAVRNGWGKTDYDGIVITGLIPEQVFKSWYAHGIIVKNNGRYVLKQSIAKRKRCPNGYHRDDNGNCVDANGNIYSEPSQAEQPKSDKPKQSNEDGGKQTAGTTDNAIRDVVVTACVTDKSSPDYEKAKKARQNLVSYVEQHDGKTPKVKVKPVYYTVKDGKFVETTDPSEYMFDGFGETPSSKIYSDENGQIIKERAEVYEEIVQKQLSKFRKPKEGEQPVLLLLGGGSGSGKSSMNKFLKEEGLVPEDMELEDMSVNSDDLMAQLPEYQRINEQNILTTAATFHDEGSNMAKTLQNLAFEGGYNFCIDGTMSKSKKYIDIINEAKRRGYKVVVRGIFKDPDIAYKHCMSRFVGNGRFVPPKIIRESNNGFRKTIHEQEILDLCDDVKVYDAPPDGQRDASPTLIYDNGDVKNKDSWDKTFE